VIIEASGFELCQIPTFAPYKPEGRERMGRGDEVVGLYIDSCIPATLADM